MPDSIRMEGRTVEAAIEAALSVLGTTQNEVDVQVLNEGTQGVFGVFGSKPAEVEVFKKASMGAMARHYLQAILDEMSLVAVVRLEKEEQDRIHLDIRGEDLGRVIGKDGALLEAFQELTASAASKRASKRIHVLLDASGYRGRREGKLTRIAKEASEKAEHTGRPVILEPMSSSDRRIIHLALQNHPKVESFSKGEKSSRRVVICLKGTVPPEERDPGARRQRGLRSNQYSSQEANRTEQTAELG